VDGLVILRFRQSSDILVTLERTLEIPGNGTTGCGQAGPAVVALMIELCAGMNGFGGANLPEPQVS
jgi:hypothetical protein